MKNLSELSLADLVSLYNNYMSIVMMPVRDQQDIARNNEWNILTRSQFRAIDNEIKKRISEINF